MSRINLFKAPTPGAILISVGVAMAVSGIVHGSLLASGEKPHTMAADWRKANEQYMKFQNMNPIFGISRDK